MVVEHSDQPHPVFERQLNYYQYRNAQPLGNGFYEVELGMGKKPKIWTLGFLQVTDRIRMVGWMRRTYNESYSATVMIRNGASGFPSQIEGKNLIREDAERMLRALVTG